MPSSSKAAAPAANGRTTSDPRFAAFQTDPRYRLPRRKDTHVKVDKRFAHMLEDEDFSSKAKVDRYGRKIGTGKRSSKGRRQLERLYDFDDQDKDDQDVVVDEDERVVEELERVGKENGGAESKYVGFDESSSSEEDDESSSEEEESEEEEDAAEVAGLQDLGSRDAPEVPMGEVTSRLAVVNLDWDHIRAVDLMAVAQSFCPPDGIIEEVAVYPSEFGRERMEREEFEGPPKELFASSKSGSRPLKEESPVPQGDSQDESQDESQEEDEFSSSEEEQDDSDIQASILKHAAAPQPEIDTRALRAYQLSRLRYYYAVLTCSSASIAHALYTSMDGREYLSTANFFDLRFIPDETTFDEKPRDVCQKLPSGYRPADFVTEALTHSNVRLTWDEEDRGRKEAQKRAFTRGKDGKPDVDDDDLLAYIGSDSDDDEDGDDAAVEVVDASQLLNGSSSKPAANESSNSSKQTKADAARQKMRLALGLSIEETSALPKSQSKATKSKDEPVVGNMQITFSSALSSTKPSSVNAKTTSSSIFENHPDDVREESTRERYIRKEKERKARRKEKARAEREGNSPGPLATVPDEAEEETNEQADAGFDDPFFTDPVAANAAARAAAKKAKREQKARDRAAEAARNAREKEELELLMLDEHGKSMQGAEFDMDEIRKAEKQAKRKGKGRKAKKDHGTTEDEANGGFEIDVADPRFKSVYEDFEYAIDPSNPRFSGTEGMKRLLEEGRRKRKDHVDAGDDGADVPAKIKDKVKKRKVR